MDIYSCGSRPTRRAPAESFTGTVWQEPIIEAPAPARVRGDTIREIKAGDVVWISPNEKHWHGAAPTTSMVHVATQEALDGKHVTWMEHVSDEQYKA